MVAGEQLQMAQLGLHALPATISIIDSAGRIVLVNQAWTDFARDNGGRDTLSVQPGANYLAVCRGAATVDLDARRAVAGIEAVLAGGAPQFAMEYACHSPEEQRWFFMTVTPLVSGESRGAIISHVDITHAKEAENAAQLSNDRFHAMAEAAPSITFETDAEGATNTFASGMWTTYTGQSAAEALGKGWMAFIHPDDLDRALVASDAAGNRECRIRGRDGTYRWFVVRGNPKRDAAGKVIKWIGSCTDIDSQVQDRHQLQQAYVLAEQLVLERTADLTKEILVRRQAEDEVRQSRELLDEFIEYAPAAIAMLDLDMCYLAASARWNARYNLLETPVGRSHYDLFPDISDAWKAMHKRCLAGATEGSDGEIWNRADGSIHWVKWEARPWRDGRGGIGGIVISSEDISERKRAEIALQDSLREVFELKAALDEHSLVSITDPDGVITFANDKFCAVSQYSREELLGQNHRIVNSGFHSKDFFHALWETIAGGRVWHGELQNRAKDGSLYWVATTIVPFLDDHGKPRQYVGIRTEVTERKLAKLALRESEQRLSLFIEHAPAAIAMFDRDMRYLATSARWRSDYDLDRDVVGKSHYDLFPEMPEHWKDIHLGALEGEVLVAEEDAWTRLDGSVQWLKWEVRPWRRGDDEIGGIVIFTEDITERKLAEQALRASKERAASLQAELLHIARLSEMGEVAAALAHEVAQPLTAIQLFAASGRRLLMSAEKQAAEKEAAVAHSVEMIETQAKRASDILKRLRDFIEKRETQRGAENLTKLIEEARALALVSSRGKPARRVLKLLPDQIEVYVDRVQIQQVLVNFLRNASDAMADETDPEIVIETAMTKPGSVRVSISDNGPGIDPLVADSLFNPFTTTKKTGMGVGLSISKTIIEVHGGEIGFYANVPRGAVFYFTLPVESR